MVENVRGIYTPPKRRVAPSPDFTGAVAGETVTDYQRRGGPVTSTRPPTYYIEGKQVNDSDYQYYQLDKTKAPLSAQADLTKLTYAESRDPNKLRLFLQSQESESATAASYLRRQALFNSLL